MAGPTIARESVAEADVRSLVTGEGIDLSVIAPGLTDERPAAALASAPTVLTARQGARLVGAVGACPLPWDSAASGRQVVRVGPVAARDAEVREALLRAALDDARGSGAELAYLRERLDAEVEPGLPERLGFHLIDVLQTFARAVPPPAGPTTLRTVREEEVETVAAIAAECFGGSRFHADPAFRARAGALHAEWVRNSVHERLVDDVLVLPGSSGLPGLPGLAGFVTVSRWTAGDARLGTIVLFGVSEAARGRGLGRQLLEATVDWAGAEGLRGLVVGTQAWNLRAVSLYVSSGFRAAACHRTVKAELSP